jgi:hypothetical protein
MARLIPAAIGASETNRGRLEKALHLFASLGAICTTIACGGKVVLDDRAAGSVTGGTKGTNTSSGNSANGTSTTGINIGSAGGGSNGAGGSHSAAGAGGATSRAGTTACGTDACGVGRCGQFVDSCGNPVDCGYVNCVNGFSALCGAVTPNVCAPCTPLDVNTADCAGSATGVQKCGPVSDGCGSFAQCPDCPTGQCCGCVALSVCDSGTRPPICGTCAAPEACDGGATPDAGPCCMPLTCADYPTSIGQMPDGCGGLTPVCNYSHCTTWSCEQACTSGECASTNDGVTYVLSCFKPDNCSGLMQCWCKIL